MTAEQRTAIYAFATALAAVLVAFGIVTQDQAATMVAAVIALTGCVVAFVHRPTRRPR